MRVYELAEWSDISQEITNAFIRAQSAHQSIPCIDLPALGTTCALVQELLTGITELFLEHVLCSCWQCNQEQGVCTWLVRPMLRLHRPGGQAPSEIRNACRDQLKPVLSIHKVGSLTPGCGPACRRAYWLPCAAAHERAIN